MAREPTEEYDGKTNELVFTPINQALQPITPFPVDREPISVARLPDEA
jgi:hypothetical protein